MEGMTHRLVRVQRRAMALQQLQAAEMEAAAHVQVRVTMAVGSEQQEPHEMHLLDCRTKGCAHGTRT